LLPELRIPANIVTRIAKDKKGESGSVYFVLLRSVGRAIIRRLSLADIQEFVNYFNDRENLSQ
jgi:3-dehydroquinate synthetase